MNLKIEVEREEDGRWIAEVTELSGCMIYGETREDAVAKVKALAYSSIISKAILPSGVLKFKMAL